MSPRPSSRRRLTRLTALAATAIGTAAVGTACAPPAPPASPAAAQQIAYGQLVARGWANQMPCLITLWNQESSWNVYAQNPSSGAYGIPQALPGVKMAAAGPDWLTNPATQIRWGLDYIAGRYGNPCNALAHERSVGWYSVEKAG